MSEVPQMIFPVPDVLGVPRAPFAALAVQHGEEKIYSIHYLPHGHSEKDHPLKNTLADELEMQLRKYFEEPESACFRNLQDKLDAVDGVPSEVQEAICDISYGNVRAYSKVAKIAVQQFHWNGKSGMEDEKGMDSAEIVGRICRRNPYAVVVPCYRVVARGGNTEFCLGELGNNPYLEAEFGEDHSWEVARRIKCWLIERERGWEIVPPKSAKLYSAPAQ